MRSVHYLRILSPDEQSFVWVKRPAVEGRSYMVINFSDRVAEFADLIDKLNYLSVEEVKRLDDKLASILFHFEKVSPENYVYMMQDIPAIMDSVLS